MRSILVLVAILLAILAIRETCKLGKESYAPQVMHGVVGGIAGPILDPKLYEYDPPGRTAELDEPHVLWAMPPEPPA